MKKLTKTETPETDEDEVQANLPTFKIFSGTLKAYEKEIDGASRKYLSCTASSTVQDLHGDIMTDECVMNMAPQAKNKSMTIFLNHSYKWPEDVAGKTTDARIVSRATGENGQKIYDLDLDFEVNESNQRALDTYEAIKTQGIKAGVSIGAMIEEWAFRDEDEGWWGGLEIKKVDLLEASIVGIPANQRSWVVNALGALGAPKMIMNKALGRETPVDAGKTIKGEGESVKSADALDPADEQDAKESVDSTDNTEVKNSTSPEGETPAEGETTGEDEQTESATLEEAAAALDSIKDSGADAGLAAIVLSFLEGATEEVVILREQLATVTTERDQLLTDVKSAAEIVETIARTPIGRKAHFTGPVDSFRQKFGGYYSEDFLKVLEGDKNE